MDANGRSGVRVGGRLTGQGVRPRLYLIVASIAVLSALAACSGSTNPYHDSLSDFFQSSPTPQQAPAPPPNPATAAAAQPGYAAAPGPATAAAGQPGYAPPSGPATAAAIAPAPATPPSEQASTLGSLTTSYVDFLNMFRDHPTAAAPVAPPSYTATAAPPAAAAAPASYSAAAAAPVPLAPPSSYGAAAAAPAPSPYTAPTPAAAAQIPSDGVHPSVSLVDLFKSDSTPARTPGVPHPPSTYTPVAPSDPGTAPAAATPPADSDAAASAYPYPQQSLSDIFSKKPDAQ